MIKIKKLLPKDFIYCCNLIIKNDLEGKYFENLGWKIHQFKFQLSKENNLSFGLFNNNLLKAFIFGDLIDVEKKIEYEILIVYVNKDDRKLGYATKLLNKVQTNFDEKKLINIYLEVAADNVSAINLYKKNQYKQIGIRKNYYLIKKKKVNAICFKKVVDE